MMVKLRNFCGNHKTGPWLAKFVCGLIFSSIVINSSLASTGIRALDEPAPKVRVADKTTLIAITRAGHRIVAVGVHGVIIYSDDNGISWTQSSVPVDLTLTAVAFVNKTDGWACGHYGVILHTTDGGVTWQVQLNGIQANNLTLAAATAENTATVTATGGVDATDPSVAQMALRRANFFVAAGPDKPFLTIWAQDQKSAMVFGAYRMVMKTTDGGKTWSDWSLHIGDPRSHNLYDVVASGNDIFIAGEIGLVFHSVDRGNNFAEVTMPTDATMFGCIATGDGGFMVFGVGGQAYRTDDVGKTWTPVSVGATVNLLAAKTMASGAIVAVAEDGTLYISRNHAHTFTQMPETQSMGLYDLAQAENGDVILVGSSGVARLPAADF
jgi:photosystem II stability/assembly factor-like uncharacterized protein